MLLHLRELDRLDHLTDCRVRCDEHWMAVLLRQVKRSVCQIHAFLNALRCQHNRAVVSVAAASCQLPVISLSHEDVAESAADTLYVNDDRRKIASAQIRYALLLERESRTRSCGQRSHSACRSSHEHVYSGQFRFGLHTCSANLIHSPAEVLKYLCLRCDRIAAEESASGAEAGFSKGFISLH